MYVPHRKLWHCPVSIRASLVATALLAASFTHARAQEPQSTSVIRKVSELSEKIELTTNTSRILTLDKNIPRVQVNNPELLAVTPLSANQVQISAKKAGVTQVNLWDSDGKVHSVDVMIYGDARELEVALQTQFPHASIKVFRYSESLVLSGYVDRPDHVSPIMQLAADYSPKVINNVQVGGVQQVLLKVKVMEMSRTKLRRMATDFTVLGSNGSFFSTGVSGLLLNTTNNVGGGVQSVFDTAGKTAEFGIVHNNNAFFGFLDWLQQNNIAKILSEPNIMAVSGRPAQFQVGGEFPIVVPQSLGTASIEFKPYGTQIDFLPIVLGNGKIRLEVRPRISQPDPSRSIVMQNFTVPALTVRQVDTAVEMQAGQTFALAGLVEERVETIKRGLPYISDMPVLGVPFRKMEDTTNEIELLIIVTPEFVDPMDACETPCNGPGMFTTQPSNRGLYCGGLMEVPLGCNPTAGLGACGQDPCARCSNGGAGNCGCNGGGPNMNGEMPMQAIPSQGMGTPITPMPGGTGYDEPAAGPIPTPATTEPTPANGTTISDSTIPSPAPADLTLPQGTAKPSTLPKPTALPPLPPQPALPVPATPASPQSAPQTQAPSLPPMPPSSDTSYVLPFTDSTATTPAYGNSRGYLPQRQPVFVRNASKPNNPQQQSSSATRPSSLIGPTGYEQ